MKRQPKKLSSSLERHLKAYALAASAAGVGALALAQPAEAKIVYTKTNKYLGGKYYLDLNHDKRTDFILQISQVCSEGDCSTPLYAIPRRKNSVEGASTRQHYAYALYRGSRIDPSRPFAGRLMARRCSCDPYGGPWYNVHNRYLGLKFRIKGKIHYGWARLNVIGGEFAMVAQITGYAYETIPNKPIIAGKTKGRDVVYAKPASLGALAAKASGLQNWRQK